MSKESPSTQLEVDKTIQRAQLIGLCGELTRICRLYFGTDPSNVQLSTQSSSRYSGKSIYSTPGQGSKMPADKNIDLALSAVEHAAAFVGQMVKAAKEKK